MVSKDKLPYYVIRINEKDARNGDLGVTEKEQGYDSVTSVFIFAWADLDARCLPELTPCLIQVLHE